VSAAPQDVLCYPERTTENVVLEESQMTKIGFNVFHFHEMFELER
jgi:hypothetical protein